MLLHPLTYTREAASCPTFLGWTAEAVGGAADGFSGGRDGMIFTPPHFVNLIVNPCCCEAAVRLRRPAAGAEGRLPEVALTGGQIR